MFIPVMLLLAKTKDKLLEIIFGNWIKAEIKYNINIIQ